MNLLDNDITTDQRPYIIELQGYLRTIQRARQGSTTVPQDGYYGPTTMEAVRQFQQEEGLTPTGQVDYATWSAIYRTYTDITTAAQPPTPIKGKGDTPLTEGDRGDPVLFLNAMIGRLSRVYNNILYSFLIGNYTLEGIGLNEVEINYAIGGRKALANNYPDLYGFFSNTNSTLAGEGENL